MTGLHLVQSLVRGLEILQLIAGGEDGGMRLNEIADRSGLKRPTAHNLISTLVAKGFVENVGGGRYRAGSSIMQLAQMQCDSALTNRAGEAVRKLASLQPRPILNYSELVGPEIIIRFRMSPDRYGVLQRPLRLSGSLYGSATGLAWQAFGDMEVRLRLRERFPFFEYGENLWGNLQALEDFLEDSRCKGCVVTPFEEQTLMLMAAPVVDEQGELRSVLGAAFRANEIRDGKTENGLIDSLINAARGIGVEGREFKAVVGGEA